MINTILYATDLEAYTTHSLLHVESLAKQFDAKVVIAHAIAPMSTYTNALLKTYATEALAPSMINATNKGTMAALKEQIFETLLRDPIAVEELLERIADIVVAIGPPATVVLQEAQRVRADLIVIGSHGVNAIDGAMLGSVASKILQLAKVPVYMVPMINPKHYRQSDNSNWTRQ